MKKLNYMLELIFPIFLLSIISFLSIYSANKYLGINNILLKQIIFYLIGYVVAFYIAFKGKNLIIKQRYFLYAFFNVLLLSLLIFGVKINGSKCWFFIFGISFQPSEFMKIILILLISDILVKIENKKEKPKLKEDGKTLLKIFVIVLIPSILTFLEPDTGVVIIYFLIALGMVIVSPINRKWYLILGGVFLFVVLSIGGLFFLKKELITSILGENIFYRLERVINWSNASGYQLQNSLTAIGSAGLFGFGFNQTPIYFPEPSTDFIFTTFASNFGLIGSLVLILIVLYFDSKIISLSKEEIEEKDKYILVGVFIMILYQQVQNIGMTVGLLPITGITLPFISYGGSSLISYMIILGIVLNIKIHKYLN